ncbi:MAG: response regulator [Thermodesulfobacteriota bacterium]
MILAGNLPPLDLPAQQLPGISPADNDHHLLMIQPLSGFRREIDFADLLQGDEIIVIVDDDPDISSPLAEYLDESGLTTSNVTTAGDLRQRLAQDNVALILLDIGLPDADGNTLIPELIRDYPSTAIIMLSGLGDIHVAIDCIRNGADDYLAKPVKFNEIFIVIKKVLERRRLLVVNRQYQEELEQANFRFQLLHQLSLKINSVYLDTTELDKLFYAILVAITAHEGLRFNRAFLALFDEEHKTLQGQLAIGPDCPEEASTIWGEIDEKQLGFADMLTNLQQCQADRQDSNLNRTVRRLSFPATDLNNIFVRSAEERRSFLIQNGRGDHQVAKEILTLLDTDSFVVVPLFSPRRPLGVIIADQYVTRETIDQDSVAILELFASQVSVAIEHSQLHRDMQAKIRELEQVTHELDHNKDLLVAAERYAALGQMAAQMMHVLRNPITAIGGLSRILGRKVDQEKYGSYLEAMNKETSRLEDTLGDLFDFVSQAEPEKEEAPFYPLLEKTLHLLQPTMIKQNIMWQLKLDQAAPRLNMDVRQIRQMLLHICRNAIEAMENGGDLLVRGQVRGSKIQIEIQDSGPGISNGNIARAKEPFFTTKSYGSGIGLAMVERIITSHDGTFTMVNSEQGMLVKLELPLAASNQAG